MKKIILSALLLTGISFGSQAQVPDQKCASYEALENTFKMYPELRQNYEASLLLQNSQHKLDFIVVSFFLFSFSL